ncbi:MAG: hypothetical protein M1838_006113 [Thelocarpon superellum]|nr:MAG: hypothetical protein M1838_006113 [Thelocarpon superellum]
MKEAEIVKHPEFPHVTWDLPPAEKGKLAVARGRGGPFNIAYEVHGHGPIHMLWIMGLGSLKTTWQRQTKDFGHDRSSEFSCLVLDNRGMGESDKPYLRYSTREMAKDTIEVLDHVGWTGEREVHVTGISMGGMIAQELVGHSLRIPNQAQHLTPRQGLLIPKRVASLTLLSTAARIVNTVVRSLLRFSLLLTGSSGQDQQRRPLQGYLENLRNRINMLIPKAIDEQVAHMKYLCFSDAFLASPDNDGNFPTNGDRFAAQEILKRKDPNNFPRHGFLLQVIAAGYHHKSATQLRELRHKVGRERIQVVHGSLDRMISLPHAEVLIKELGGPNEVRYVVFEGVGHVIPMESRQEFKQLMLDFIEKTRALDAKDALNGGAGP